MSNRRRNTVIGRGRSTKPQEQSLSPTQQQQNTPEVIQETPQLGKQSPDLKSLKNINPDDWKNIAIPLVDAIKSIINHCTQQSLMQGMDSRKITMLDKQGVENMKAVQREILACKDLIKSTKTTLEDKIRNDVSAIEKITEEKMRFQMHKEIMVLEKKVNETIDSVQFDIKSYTNTTCETIYGNMKQEYQYYVDRKTKEIKALLDVEGIVDSFKFENNMDARAKGMWCNLSDWLKDNDTMVREKFLAQEEKMKTLMVELDKLEPMRRGILRQIDDQDPKFNSLEKLLKEKIKEQNDKSGRIEKKLDETKSHLFKANTSLEKDLKKLDKNNEKSLAKIEDNLSKLKTKLADLYFQVNEEEESEVTSQEEMLEDSEPTPVEPAEKSQRSEDHSRVIKRKSTKISIKSKKSSAKLLKDPSNTTPILEEEDLNISMPTQPVLSPVSEKQSSRKMASTPPPMKSNRTKSPKKTPRDLPNEEKKKRVPKQPKGADEDGKSSHGGGTKGSKSTNATNMRIEKIEKYLHDRFDWLGIIKQEKKPLNEKSKSKDNSKEIQMKDLPKLMSKKTKYKYTVDTSEKPQDPGKVNELCFQRQKLQELRNMKIHNNILTVNALEKFSELENGVFVHSDKARSQSPQYYSQIDPETNKYTYKYEAESQLQMKSGNRPSTTQDDMRNFIEINFNQAEFQDTRQKRQLFKTLQFEDETNRYTPNQAVSMGTGTLDEQNPANLKMILDELHNVNQFAKLQLKNDNPNGLYNGKRNLFQGPGKIILPHDKNASKNIIGQDFIVTDAKYTMTNRSQNMPKQYQNPKSASHSSRAKSFGVQKKSVDNSTMHKRLVSNPAFLQKMVAQGRNLEFFDSRSQSQF